MMVVDCIIFAILLHFVQTTPCNITRQCMIRINLVEEMNFLQDYKTCEDVHKKHCICQQPIDILFTETPPYIFTDPKTGTVTGLIPGMLKQALDSCCFHSNCTTINYLKPYTSSLEALEAAKMVTLLAPFATYTGAKTSLTNTFVEFIKSRGVSYIGNEDRSYTSFQRFFASVGSNWPLFGLSLLLALDAGIVIWLLDSSRNQQDFPRKFKDGIIEGMWWAFVSMTTVGYGDKTPKSLVARFFGIVWITVGISLCGVFTASLTTGMTQSFIDEDLYLSDKRVGVLNKTNYEMNIAMREGAKVTGFSSYIELKNALINGQIDGILMDSLILKHYAEDLENSITNFYSRSNVLENSPTSYGILFAYDHVSNHTNAMWASFLSGFFDENRDNLDLMLKLAEEQLPMSLHTAHDHINSSPKSLFNDPVVYTRLFQYVGLATLGLLIFGFVYDRLWLAARFYKASRQEKWMNKIEEEPRQSPRHRQSQAQMLDNTTISRLQNRFKVVMKEIEIEDGEKDYSQITDKINQMVFESGNFSNPPKNVLIEMEEIKAPDNDAFSIEEKKCDLTVVEN
ncbi:uncharacterized protein LOC135687428 [Rhopilema esculentum]|uniref:uncharacterized protein LOC135687428 n=1 Tax=Rhopilema esculentum TaxID=499914 RepID=UPI0031DA4488